MYDWPQISNYVCTKVNPCIDFLCISIFIMCFWFYWYILYYVDLMIYFRIPGNYNMQTITGQRLCVLSLVRWWWSRLWWILKNKICLQIQPLKCCFIVRLSGCDIWRDKLIHVKAYYPYKYEVLYVYFVYYSSAESLNLTQNGRLTSGHHSYSVRNYPCAINRNIHCNYKF